MTVETGSKVEAAIRGADGPAICAYVTAGYPTLDGFRAILEQVASVSDVVEVGVPFTDPMADGMTIQRASHVALEGGVTLGWILEQVAAADTSGSPVLLMGYYNPFLAYGLGRLGPALADAGVAGLIVPDLPHEEASQLLEALSPFGVGLVQLVTETTSESRLEALVEASSGFVYAVTTTGVTGGDTSLSGEILAYLDRVKASTTKPVLAGFGIRNSSQVAELAGHVDGVVVGSALIEAIDDGMDPGRFVEGLRGGRT